MTMRTTATQPNEPRSLPPALAQADALATLLPALRSRAPGDALRALVDADHDRLPLPGGGHTAARLRALSLVAAHDLSLVKLYEGHTDALAILRELGASPPLAPSTLGVWAAEARDARVHVSRMQGATTLHGRKAWCSGAASLTHALVTVWSDEPQPLLALVDLRSPGVHVTDEGFVAIGMAATRSVDVRFEGARATVVGGPGAYLSRPGFWQGAVGIAACWYGGALGLAEALRQRAARSEDPLLRAHLGAVDVALAGARAMLHEAATTIDAAPSVDAQALALRTRAVVERAVREVIDHVGRGVGAAPYCRDEAFARRAADLPVFVRQSHADHDLAALGALVASAEGGASWAL